MTLLKMKLFNRRYNLQQAITTIPCEMILELILFKDSEVFYIQKYEKRDCLVNLYLFVYQIKQVIKIVLLSLKINVYWMMLFC